MGKEKTQTSCPTCETLAIVAICKTSEKVEKPPVANLPKTAQERIEALRSAGVNVDNMFAMVGANGGEYIGSNRNGELVILADNDPIFDQIIQQGTVPNSRLFRRWVMAQMFHMLSATTYRSQRPIGVTQMIHRMGYDYQWKMLLDELYAQMKMEKRDLINFTDRNRWFNREVVVEMAEDYIKQLKNFVETKKNKHCKGVSYKRISGRNIFVVDLEYKLYEPLRKIVREIKMSRNVASLYNLTKRFHELRVKMPSDTHQSRAWIDAYKGSGAFFTMQNLIRFHNCTAIDERGRRLSKTQSIALLDRKAEEYCNGEGWRLLAVLKKMLIDNNIDIKRKQAEWRKK
ncbi:MAG: ubiquitin carboxyl-hydrolase [Rikenellaceae bacterium]